MRLSSTFLATGRPPPAMMGEVMRAPLASIRDGNGAAISRQVGNPEYFARARVERNEIARPARPQ